MAPAALMSSPKPEVPSNMKVMRRKLMSESDLYKLTPNSVQGSTMGTVITNSAQ